MWQLLIILVIVVLLFGTKRLKNIGSDLGGAIKGFKSAVTDEKDADFDGDKQVEEKKQADGATTEQSTAKTKEKS